MTGSFCVTDLASKSVTGLTPVSPLVQSQCQPMPRIRALQGCCGPYSFGWIFLTWLLCQSMTTKLSSLFHLQCVESQSPMSLPGCDEVLFEFHRECLAKERRNQSRSSQKVSRSKYAKPIFRPIRLTVAARPKNRLGIF